MDSVLAPRGLASDTFDERLTSSLGTANKLLVDLVVSVFSAAQEHSFIVVDQMHSEDYDSNGCSACLCFMADPCSAVGTVATQSADDNACQPYVTVSPLLCYFPIPLDVVWLLGACNLLAALPN